MVEEVRGDASIEENEPLVNPSSEEKSVHPEIRELQGVIEELHILGKTCEILLKETSTLNDQSRAQKKIHAYAHELRRIPHTLQLINDLRRYILSVEQHAETTRNNLIVVRGGEEDAITSEEARIIISCSSYKDYLLASITNLEGTLTHIRNTTHELLTIISYHEPGFLQQAKNALATINPEYVSSVVHGEQARLITIAHDLNALYELDAHVEDVSNA